MVDIIHYENALKKQATLNELIKSIGKPIVIALNI